MNPAKKSISPVRHVDIPRRVKMPDFRLALRLALFIGVSYLVISATLSFAATITASLQPSFQANLTNSLIPSLAAVGAKTPTFTRATAATQTDFEGLLHQTLSGEARFQGARRVRNYVTQSDTFAAFGNAGYSLTGGQTDPLGGNTAYRLKATTGGNLYFETGVYDNTGATKTTSIWMRRVTGTGLVYLSRPDLTLTAKLTTSWQRFTTTGTDNWGFSMEVNVLNDEVDIWHPQYEIVSGQSNQNPSEYVSNGTLSAPFHGAGVDGVQYFNTLNGNTVASNVVTEATGAAINSTTAKWGQFPGGSGGTDYFSTPSSSANQITGDIDIRAVVSMNDWTPPVINAIVAKDDIGSNRDYAFVLNTNGTLGFNYSHTGAGAAGSVSSVTATGFADGTKHGVRATYSSSTGAVTFYTSEDFVVWTVLGSGTITASTIHAGTTPLEIGRQGGSPWNPMIGRIYRAQVYNGIGGTLVADFNPNTYSSGSSWQSTATGETWTANGNASVFTGSGLWDAGGPLGYLAEGSRTNLKLDSQDWTTANWLVDGNRLTRTASAATAPDGTLTATQLMETAVTNYFAIAQNHTKVASALTYTTSAFFKPNGRNYLKMQADDNVNGATAMFNVATGAVVSTATFGSGFLLVSASIVPYPNGWYRTILTFTTTATVTLNNYVADLSTDGTTVNYAGDVTKGVYAWGAQLEQAAFPSSYIPTTSGSATRNVDLLTYVAAGNISGVAGTTYAETALASGVRNFALNIGEVDILDVNAINAVPLYLNSGTAKVALWDGTGQRLGNVYPDATTVTALASMWGGSVSRIYINGAASADLAFDGALEIAGNLRLGGVASAPYFGTIRNIKIWKKALTDTQLTNLTSTNAAVAKTAVPLASTVAASTNPTFQANLTNSLIPSIAAFGHSTPTFTRADGADGRATFTDFEGLIHPVLAGEARFQGARRVQNLFSDPTENCASSGWLMGVGGTGVTATKTSNYTTAPDGTLTACRLQFDKGAGNTTGDYARLYNGLTAAQTAYTQSRLSVWAKTNDGSTIVATMKDGIRDGTGTAVTIGPAWQRIDSGLFTNTANVNGQFIISLQGNRGNNQTADISVWRPQAENVTGQTNQNPSEYVSVGVSPAPYHGAGVDGVQYFNTLNGNTVASNVVTAATGAAITSAQSAAAGGVTAGVVDAGGPLGYLAEGSRTNLALQSEDINTTWTNFGSDTIGANSTAAPDGNNTADKLSPVNTVNRQHFVYQNVTVSPNTAYVFSTFMKAAGNSWGYIRIVDDTTTWYGSFDTVNCVVGAGAAAGTKVTAFPNGWCRVSVPITTSGTATGIQIAQFLSTGDGIISYTGVVGNGAYFWGAQLEAASFPSSYIPTGSGSVTRNADVLTYPGAGNMASAQGTLNFEIYPNETAAQMGIPFAMNGLSGYIGTVSGGTLMRFFDGFFNDDWTSVPAQNTLSKWVLSWNSAGTHMYKDGAKLSPDVYNSLNPSFAIGANLDIAYVHGLADTQLYGTIRNVKIWKNVQPDSTLTKLTSTTLAISRAAVPKTTVNASTNNSLTNGLVGLWSFDGKDMSWGATNIAYDRSGQGNNGTTTGMTQSSAVVGKIGQALKFNGTSSYVDIANSNSFGITTGDFSVSFWMKPTTWSGYMAPLSNSMFGSAWDGFHFEEEAGAVCTLGGMRFDVSTNSNIVACWNTVITTGKWYNVVGTRSNGTIQIYVNGVAGVSASGSNSNVNVGRDYLIGRNPDTTYPRYFNGSIDDVRVYNRALSPTEVKQLYNLGK